MRVINFNLFFFIPTLKTLVVHHSQYILERDVNHSKWGKWHVGCLLRGQHQTLNDWSRGKQL